MKCKGVVFLLAAVTAASFTTIVLAFPKHDNASTPDHHRSRRDLTGIFDALAYGVDGLMNGMNSMSKSIVNAFDSVFSANNLHALTDGFFKFKQGVKDAINGVNGAVSNGFKKIGDKFSNGYSNADGYSNTNPNNFVPPHGHTGGSPRSGVVSYSPPSASTCQCNCNCGGSGK